MQWDKRKVYGMPPTGRGYHGAVLHDSRLFVIGGFDGFVAYLRLVGGGVRPMLTECTDMMCLTIRIFSNSLSAVTTRKFRISQSRYDYCWRQET